MTSFTFKETKQKTMKIVGLMDVDAMIIEVDGAPKKLSTLLSPFNGSSVEINVNIKETNPLNEPEESASDEE